jgi:hypothetical protein
VLKKLSSSSRISFWVFIVHLDLLLICGLTQPNPTQPNSTYPCLAYPLYNKLEGKFISNVTQIQDIFTPSPFYLFIYLLWDHVILDGCYRLLIIIYILEHYTHIQVINVRTTDFRIRLKLKKMMTINDPSMSR